MKRLLFVIFLFGVFYPLWAQQGENLFEWNSDKTIAVRQKFLGIKPDWDLGDIPLYTYKEYNVSSDNNDSYVIKLRGAGNEEMSDLGDYDFFEIYHNGDMILRHLPYGLLYDVRYITLKRSKDYFIKVPLSEDSFALFLGGWLYGSGAETPEMVVVVVSGGTAKVVFDNFAYSYKYTSGGNFSIEYVDDINGLYDDFSKGFTDSFLNSRTKYKIWKEGDMLKYKSWK